MQKSTASAPRRRLQDRSSILTQWQDSIVAVWTPTTHASGFLVGTNGLIATNQRVIGTTTSVEVQLTPGVKVAASVLVADAVRDVAVLWIDPTAAASVRPVPLGCAEAAQPSLVDGQEIFTIGTPLRQPKGSAAGTVSRVEAQAIVSDLILPAGSAGGPVFTAGGALAGITSIVDENGERRQRDTRVVRIGDVCDLVAAAGELMKTASPPDGRQLPVEPLRPFPVDALKDAAERRAGSLSPYQMSSSEFDIAFITPVLTFGAQYQSEQARRRERDKQGRTPAADPGFSRALMDFGNWSEYVADFPPVLLIRVTPKLVEGFWTKVARGAAQTQGVAVPPLKRFKSGFSRMRAFCGDAEVLPIHPFKLERRISESEAIYEGLYAFDRRRARAGVRERQAPALLGEGAREGGHPGRRCEGARADLAGLRTISGSQIASAFSGMRHHRPPRGQVGGCRCGAVLMFLNLFQVGRQVRAVLVPTRSLSWRTRDNQ